MSKKNAHKKCKTNKNISVIAKHRVSCGFCHFEDAILVLNVLGTPSAKRDVIGKAKGDQLKISVTAAPTKGKATDHMVAFLAREFAVKVSQIEVVFGRMNINKQVRITAPQKLPAVVARFLNQ